MTETKATYTPGPWKVNDNGDGTNFISAANGKDVADSRSGVDELGNARLIAAAPELLAACKRFMEAHEDGIAAITWGTQPPCQCGPCNEARAAIARAEGAAS